MNLSTRILSDIVCYNSYARHLHSKHRRETWEEIVNRNKAMHIKKYPKLIEDIETNYKYVMDKKVLPSMRVLQFAGKPIELSPNRAFNCSYTAIDDWHVFQEIFFLLLGGSGVGFSVQSRHIDKLPPVYKPKKSRRFLIGDSIEGWADALRALIRSYMCGKSLPCFDFSDIRAKGTPLKTSGGTAPGPEPLSECLFKVKQILDRKEDGEKLTSIECHDVVCHVAMAVYAGGIRRSSCISLFDREDYDMLTAKYNSWQALNGQRQMSNNSVMLPRESTSHEDFLNLWEKIRLSGSGEPGFVWSNNLDIGRNPCGEVSLNSDGQFCNLSSVNTVDVRSQKEFNERARVASFIGTLQASYTDFHFIREKWQKTTEEEALLGVSLAGVASGSVMSLNLREAAETVVAENERVAELIGINKAARTTCEKPDGNTSCVLGCSSGVHAWHSPYYIRRVKIDKSKPIY